MAELKPITDYASLKNAVTAMSDRTDAEYINSVPLFIQQGETRLFRHLRCPGNEAVATFLAATFDNVHGVAIPDNYLEAKWALYYDTPLERISDLRYFTLSQGPAGVAPACPRYFARVVDQLLFWPHADQNLDVRIGYYEAQGPLSGTLPWVKMLRIAPFAYLYGALAEGARFTRDATLLAMWDQKFDEELASVNMQGYDNEVAGSTVVVSDLNGGW
jgi:hypothetical protein